MSLSAPVAEILEAIGVETQPIADDRLEQLVAVYGLSFPTTVEMSEFARGTAGQAAPVEDPDGTLMQWLDQEFALFRALEKRIVSERLREGFDDDVEGFIAFSLSVQNRRKARAGRAFENHLEAIFQANKLDYSRGQFTEGRSTPDFVFPCINDYHNANFPARRLTMLAVKSTCKERWRQILQEASRVKNKHLATLEPGISKNQTDEMQGSRVQLVIPASIQPSFAAVQLPLLLDIKTFVSLAKRRQAA